MMKKIVLHTIVIVLTIFLIKTPGYALLFKFQNHFYGLTSTEKNWLAAQEEAKNAGGNLAEINSQEEQQFIENTFLLNDLERRPLWIGLFQDINDPSYSEPKGAWKWINGRPYSFTDSYSKWKSAEPNDYYGFGTENYVAINWEYARYTGPKGTWNDTPLGGTWGFHQNTDGPYYGLIEITASVHEPTTFWLLGIGIVGLAGLKRKLKRANLQ